MSNFFYKNNECLKQCDPQIVSFSGNTTETIEYNEMTLFIPKCCGVKITTSVGEIILPPQQTNWSFCQKFDCTLTEYNLEGDCVDDIHSILMKTI